MVVTNLLKTKTMTVFITATSFTNKLEELNYTLLFFLPNFSVIYNTVEEICTFHSLIRKTYEGLQITVIQIPRITTF